jgi:hypothetical protein
LPHHDESATDWSRRALSGVYRDGSGFRANTETKNETRREEMAPRVSDTLPDTCEEAESGGEENGATTAEHFIQRVSEPTSQNGTAKLDDKETIMSSSQVPNSKNDRHT